MTNILEEEDDVVACHRQQIEDNMALVQVSVCVFSAFCVRVSLSVSACAAAWPSLGASTRGCVMRVVAWR